MSNNFMQNRTLKNSGSRRGVTSVEVAIVLPVAFLLMYSLFDFGRAITTKQLLDNAVRAAARQAVVGTTTLTTANLQTTVSNYMGSLALQGMNVQVYATDPTTGANLGSWTSAALGQCIAVQVTGNYVPLIPKFSFLPNPLAMGSKCVMYSEAN
jgi:Flp pilus assembly protein TadG